MTKFTSHDVEDWKSFEQVRKSGRYNMFDPRARQATGLNGERYFFVMRNFSELKAFAGKEKQPSEIK